MKYQKFKKSDLKTGMIVKTRSGDTGLVMLDNCFGVDAIVFSGNNWTELDEYDDDLYWCYRVDKKHGFREETRDEFTRSVDIMKIYEPDLPTGFLRRANRFNKWLPVWERSQPIPEYTMSEIIEKVGHEFKLKK